MKNLVGKFVTVKKVSGEYNPFLGIVLSQEGDKANVRFIKDSNLPYSGDYVVKTCFIKHLVYYGEDLDVTGSDKVYHLERGEGRLLEFSTDLRNAKVVFKTKCDRDYVIWVEYVKLGKIL